ncbi:MAG TPA: hypothetical protein VFA29_13480 [Candidatus Baltobacteraceae bacterium]|nr:hypothetical protein [Candidatus Baltobacteraceae bacterium]
MKRFGALALAALAVSGCSSRSVPSVPNEPLQQAVQRARAVSGSLRDAYYYQTQYYNNIYQSLSPIWKHGNPATGKPYVTDLIVAAFHLGYDGNNKPYIHLNDNIPQDPMFKVMWRECEALQDDGVTVRMMLGGAAQGSYADLFAHWKTFYPILKSTIAQYKLDGIDLDVEENVTLPDIERLIAQLSADFGPKFVITLAPVATALQGGANLSGFSYDKLYKGPQGKNIAYFDAQFYSGFGSLQTPADYENVVAHGYPPDKVVAGAIDNPSDGSGYVPPATVAKTVRTLVAKYPAFGGVVGWEYFNAEPGGQTRPDEWSAMMAKAMGL